MEEIGVFNVITPGEVLDDMRSIDTEMKIMQSEIMDSPIADNRLRNAIDTFVKEWEDFYEDNSGAGSRMMNSTILKVSEYKRRLSDWRETMKKAGIFTATTDLYRAKEMPSGSGWSIPWWGWLGGAGILYWLFSGGFEVQKRSHHKKVSE